MAGSEPVPAGSSVLPADPAGSSVLPADPARSSVLPADPADPADSPGLPADPTGGAEEPGDGAGSRDWWRHEDGRWVVGDPGRQPEVTPIPSTLIAATRPDTIIDGGTVDDLVFRAVSLRGLQHQQTGKPRQDAYLVRPTLDGHWLVGCVADGVSEGRRSHVAADLVCRELTTVLGEALTGFDPDLDDDEQWAQAVRRLPWQEAVDRASASVIEAATDALRAVHERRGDEAQAAAIAEQPLEGRVVRGYMSATAIAFLVSARPTTDGRHPFAVVVAAGDSSVYLLRRGGWQHLAGGKPDGDETSGTVSPLPRPVRVEPLHGGLEPGDALVVATDGLGDQLGSGRGVVGQFLAEMWATPPDLLSFAQHAAFYRRSYADDRTAVVVWAGTPPR